MSAPKSILPASDIDSTSSNKCKRMEYEQKTNTDKHGGKSKLQCNKPKLCLGMNQKNQQIRQFIFDSVHIELADTEPRSPIYSAMSPSSMEVNRDQYINSKLFLDKKFVFRTGK